METETKVTEEKTDPANDPAYLKMLIEHYAKDRDFLVSRKLRLTDLMKRKSTKKWKPEKTKKMIRRYNVCDKASAEIDNLIDQVKLRIQQIERDKKKSSDE